MLHVKRVAVLGASPIAAQIAAHFINAGFQVYLFDLPGVDPQKNLIVEDAIRGLGRLRPSPLLKPEWAANIIPANYEDDIHKLTLCDLVIEAISDQLEWKAELYKKITPYLREDVVFTTNTSNLTIHELAEHVPNKLLPRFCGMHFFNPPRYLPLVELIKHKKTDKIMLDNLENFLIVHLGKYIVHSRDIPCFIGNRIGMFVLLTALRHAEDFDLRLDVVDKLTGPLVGHAKSATLGALDLVGLDTFAGTVRNVAQHFPDDPWHDYFEIPSYLQQLIDKDALGLKSGKGIYKQAADGRYIYDIKDGTYRPVTGQIHKEVQAILRENDIKKRFKKLRTSKIPDAKFLWAYYRDIWLYCAHHLPTIANNVREIDETMRWGFAWSQGPFELWQALGWKTITNVLIEEGLNLPAWVTDLGAMGCYENENGYNPNTKKYEPRRQLPIYEKLKPNFKSTMYEDESVIMRKDNSMAVLSFKTKMCITTQDVLTGIRRAIPIAEKEADALILWQDKSENFSVGADLNAYLEIINEKDFGVFDERLANIQACCTALRYSDIPTVAALRGYALGGGCELAMHCTRRVAHIETQMGLVESSVGVLPAGGGCKEMALRASEIAGDLDIMQWLSKAFLTLAEAKVSSNAVIAKDYGFLRESDPLIMHPSELLYAAKQQAKSLVIDGYVPPRRPNIRVVGTAGWARMATLLLNQYEGGFISEHDYIIAQHIAKVLSGGLLDADSVVTEEWLLRLEREAFLELISTTKTAERIAHTLKTRKALRN